VASAHVISDSEDVKLACVHKGGLNRTMALAQGLFDANATEMQCINV